MLRHGLPRRELGLPSTPIKSVFTIVAPKASKLRLLAFDRAIELKARPCCPARVDMQQVHLGSLARYESLGIGLDHVLGKQRELRQVICTFDAGGIYASLVHNVAIIGNGTVSMIYQLAQAGIPPSPKFIPTPALMGLKLSELLFKAGSKPGSLNLRTRGGEC